MLTEAAALGTMLAAPLFTNKINNTTSLYAMGSFLTLYVLSMIDGAIYFKPGISPVQPLVTEHFAGLALNYKF